MSEKPSFVYVTFIAAPQEKVWHALTDAKTTSRYLSGFHVETDLKAGGASRFQKGEQVLNRGVVLACEPPRKLQVTWKPEMGDFASEKPSRVTFEVEAMGAHQSKLTIVHDDFCRKSLRVDAGRCLFAGLHDHGHLAAELLVAFFRDSRLAIEPGVKLAACRSLAHPGGSLSSVITPTTTRASRSPWPSTCTPKSRSPPRWAAF